METNQLRFALLFVMHCLCPAILIAQNCNCKETFLWAKKSFEQNDAGFSYILDQKGEESYSIHNRNYLDMVGGITNGDSCAMLIRRWVKFFRIGHFGINVNQTPLQNPRVSGNEATKNNRDAVYLNTIDSNTLYLRIPSFAYERKREIDSVIQQHLELITHTKNLVIDIRNNGGGSDNSFQQLIPLIYTNPIRSIGVAYLSTPNNNLQWETYKNRPGTSDATKAIYTKFLDTLNAHIGTFVSLSGQAYWTTTYDVIYQYPSNVAVIINGKNGSTAEQFLLAAKQSKKVKLFGATTMGELDISNMYAISSPDQKFTMWYCTSKSLRIPGMTIDNKGIEPDFYMDKDIQEENWIPFICKTMAKW